MCWNAEASWGFAVVGATAAGYLIAKKESPLLWLPVAYFAAMELLQGLSWPVVDRCELPSNQLYTLLAWLHACFQPFMGGMLALAFIPEAARKRAAFLVVGASTLAALIMLVQVFPFEWAGPCRLGRTFCGEALCTYTGEWHLAWSVPLNDLLEPGPQVFYDSFPLRFLFGDATFHYLFAMFGVPFLIGSWRFALYNIVIGPPLVRFALVDGPNEWPTIWCLFSVAIILLIVITPLRRLMTVPRAAGWTTPKG